MAVSSSSPTEAAVAKPRIEQAQELRRAAVVDGDAMHQVRNVAGIGQTVG